MNKNGFTLIECVIAILIFSLSIGGLITNFYVLDVNIKFQKYQTVLTQHYHNIMMIFDARPDYFIDNLKIEYENYITYDEEFYYITIPLSFTLEQVDKIQYQIKYQKINDYNEIKINVTNVIKDYEYVNAEIFSRRIGS